MDVAAMKHMTSNFAKLDKFERVDFIRWQKKMHLLFSSMSVVYVLTTSIPEDGGDDATVEQIRKRNMWDNDDYVCRELWNSLEVKYMAEDASSKKFLVSTDSRPVMEQYNEHLDFKHTLKNKEELTLVELGSHLRIEESLGAQDSDKPKGNNVAGPHMLDWAISTKRKQDMSKDGLIPTFDMDTEKCKTCMLTKIAKKPFQNVKRETEVLELIHSDLSDLHVTPSFGNKKYFVTFIDDASRAVVRLPDPKLKTFSKRGIEGIFVGYAEHSKAFRFYVIEPNDSVLINSIIESRDVIFDENKFSSVPRPSQRPLINRTEDIGCSVVLRGTRDEVSNQHSYCFNVEDDLKAFDEVMKSHGVAFWKEAINDEVDSIMGNNTWVLADLPPCCKPISCKWIFKRKLKVDRTIEKFKARLVIQDFKQKSRIDYIDTYAPVARISTIRLLIAVASIHNLIIHQMDVKTAFLNGDLDEEFDEVVLSNDYLLNQADKCVYSKFDETGKGVIICLYVDDMLIFGTDQVQVDLTKEFLSSRFSMKDMGEADVILGIRIKHESNGIAISQSHYIEKVLKKFNYFDCTPVSTPMDTSEKLMPNNGQAVSQLEYSRWFEVQLQRALLLPRRRPRLKWGARIKHESNRIAISQSYYIEKVLKKFNCFNCTPISTPMDTSEKLLPNNGQVVSQLECSRVIDCLMYVITYTRPDIAFTMGKLSRYTSNPGTQHWQAIQRISNTKDNSSTSGWVFLLGNDASKKQTCISGSTMKSEFVALAAAS
ncbi:zinc finger, CCHC-type containing protein [Tanacetum coccineum]